MNDRNPTQYEMQQQFKSDELDNEMKQLQIDKHKQDIKIGQRTIKYWWIAFVISIVSAVIVPLYIHNVETADKKQTQEQIKDLQLKLQQTNANMLSILDSLLKKEHNVFPSRK